MWGLTTGKLLALLLVVSAVLGGLSSAQGEILTLKATVSGDSAPDIVSSTKTEKLVNGDFEIWPFKHWDRVATGRWHQ